MKKLGRPKLVLSGILACGLASFLIVARPYASVMTRDITDSRTMRAQLLSISVLHISVENARTIMQREGFECTPIKNGQFGSYLNTDYLYCTRIDGGLFNPVKRKWQIALIEKDDATTDVVVQCGFVGP